MKLKSICLASMSLLLLSSCSSRIKAPQNASPDLKIAAVGSGANAGNAGPGEKFDLATDELVCKECLKAWRIALSHDKSAAEPAELKRLKEEDEAASMQILQELSARFPKVSYVKTMMGQVKQHFGKKEEAAALYEEASLLNRSDPILIFKAAEMRRKNGQTARAKNYYEEVLLLSPKFPGAKLGLAQCLLVEEGGKEKARLLVDELIALNPDDTEAKALAERISSTAGSKAQAESAGDKN